ncbi:MAG: CNNM domain-containing protein [candidate division WOR-3 bacterium]
MVELPLLLVLLSLSFVFSGFEAALFSTLKAEIEKIKNEYIRKIVKKLKENEPITLLTLLVCNTIVNAYAASLFSALFSEKLKISGLSSGSRELLEIFLFTFLILLFGELSPKLISIKYHMGITRIFSLIIAPFFTLINTVYSAFARRPKERAKPGVFDDSEVIDELEELALGTDPDLRSRISLLHLKTQDVMTPASKVVTVNPDTTVAEFKEIVRKTNHSNYPVIKECEVLGIVSIHNPELYMANPGEKIQKFLHQCPKVPSTTNVLKVIREHMECDFLIVIDEYGNFLGVVTLDDILERLFPDINIKWLGKKKLIVPGDILTPDLEMVIGKTLPFESPTLQAIIMEQTGRIPDEGERIDLGELNVEILEKEFSKIKKVVVELK